MGNKSTIIRRISQTYNHHSDNDASSENDATNESRKQIGQQQNTSLVRLFEVLVSVVYISTSYGPVVFVGSIVYVCLLGVLFIDCQQL